MNSKHSVLDLTKWTCTNKPQRTGLMRGGSHPIFRIDLPFLTFLHFSLLTCAQGQMSSVRGTYTWVIRHSAVLQQMDDGQDQVWEGWVSTELRVKRAQNGREVPLQDKILIRMYFHKCEILLFFPHGQLWKWQAFDAFTHCVFVTMVASCL